MIRHKLIPRAAIALLGLPLGACGESKTSEARLVAGERPGLSPVVAMATTTGDEVRTTAGTVIAENVSYATAEAAFDAKRYGEAADMFTAYTMRKPQNAWGHYMLGLAAWKAGEPARAESALIRAIELDSAHVKSFINLSRVRLDLGRPEEALESVEQAIVIDGEHPDGYRVLGRVRAELGQSDEAIDAYRQAIIRDTTDAWSMNNLGFVLIQQGRFEEALGPLARAVEVRDVAVFHNNLGIALERSGQLVLAAESFRRALAVDSSYTKASASLARVDGRTRETDVTPVNLSEISRAFIEEVGRWREDKEVDAAHDC